MSKYDEEIPENIKGAIDRYVEHRIGPGSFTRAVLENNLSMAIGKADRYSYANLSAIVRYVYNHIPSPAWGSKEAVKNWLDKEELNA